LLAPIVLLGSDAGLVRFDLDFIERN